MRVELVTHCYRYPTLLRFHLSSLLLQPPRQTQLMVTVFYADEDGETRSVLEWFGEQPVPNITWRWWRLPVLELCRRSIGRNRAALTTEADWVWFCDVDYWFDERCWETFARGFPAEAQLVYPDTVAMHRTRELGDACIEATRCSRLPVQAELSGFEPQRMPRAIGGVQIVRGDVCREHGYLRHSRRAQSPAPEPEFTQCREDVWFRRQLGTAGLRTAIPGIYRIRHSKAGRNTPGLVL